MTLVEKNMTLIGDFFTDIVGNWAKTQQKWSNCDKFYFLSLSFTASNIKSSYTRELLLIKFAELLESQKSGFEIFPVLKRFSVIMKFFLPD